MPDTQDPAGGASWPPRGDDDQAAWRGDGEHPALPPGWLWVDPVDRPAAEAALEAEQAARRLQALDRFLGPHSVIPEPPRRDDEDAEC